jgi:predicted amidohydrolase
MLTFWVALVSGLLLVACVGAAADSQPQDQGKELVTNGDFTAAGAALGAPERGDLPAGWTVWQAEWDKARCTVARTGEGLLVEAPGRPEAVGGVTQEIRGIRGGQAYAISASCRLKDVTDRMRTALVHITWTKGGQSIHPAGMIIDGPLPGGPEAAFADVLVAPAEADGARLSLEVKWPKGGTVLWRHASIRPAAAAPKPRKVRIGTVYLRPKDSTPQRNMELWCAKIDQAGKLGLDIVCLCESIRQIGTKTGAAGCAETIPGPDTVALGQAAARNKMWVVAGLMERDGDTLYNTAVLIDRQGKLAGKYRKIHLPMGEWQDGVTPGKEYPVFQTDFGKVGIMICYDWFFPEAAGIFARHGAEVLFAPTWGTTFRDKDGCVEGENIFRVRARDNGMYLVPSVYDGSSMVIDPLGRILATSDGEKEGVYWAEVDLALREPLWWVGHWRRLAPLHRMPETYGPIRDE